MTILERLARAIPLLVLAAGIIWYGVVGARVPYLNQDLARVVSLATGVILLTPPFIQDTRWLRFVAFLATIYTLGRAAINFASNPIPAAGFVWLYAGLTVSVYILATPEPRME